MRLEVIVHFVLERHWDGDVPVISRSHAGGGAFPRARARYAAVAS